MDLSQFNQKKSVPFRAIWKKLEQTGFKFYCVSCDRERRLHVPARSGSIQFYIHIAVSTAFAMLITWPLFHFKGVVLALPIYIGFEVLYRMKMRAMLVCPDCDFDPVLFLSDRPQAIQKVENVWKKKFEEKGYPFPDRKKPQPKQRYFSQPMTSKTVESVANTPVAKQTSAEL